MAKNDGGPAFPRLHLTNAGVEGMSLRDWFAGLAMSAITEENPYRRAKFAYEVADAMVAQRGEI